MHRPNAVEAKITSEMKPHRSLTRCTKSDNIRILTGNLIYFGPQIRYPVERLKKLRTGRGVHSHD